VPAVAADSPGLRDSVVDGETGLLVPYGDPAAMARAAAALLADPERLAAMGARAARRARGFRWDATAAETMAQIEALLAEDGP
jgi:glycosyltransferase involved in cell wall biosynthesis